MCGFVGIFDPQGRAPIDRLLLERMNRTQRHRGPDGEGMHLAPGIGLAHTRLAIIDLATGAQPMFNEDGSVVVVYNGEIYNFRDLRDELRARGHRFRSASDTEVIVHAWEEWGEACVARLRGMFAFALWDERQQMLFLARDRLGIKPLHYAILPDGQLVFASELKALLAHPDLPRRIDPCAVEDYLAYGYVPDPKTIYRGVTQAAAGALAGLARRPGGAAPGALLAAALCRARRSSARRARPRSCWSVWRRRWRCAWSPTCRSAPSCPAASTPAPWSP